MPRWLPLPADRRQTVYHVNVVLAGAANDHHLLWCGALGARRLPHLATAWRFVKHGGAKRQQAFHRPMEADRFRRRQFLASKRGGLSQTDYKKCPNTLDAAC